MARRCVDQETSKEAKACYRAVENTTTMGCNARKTNKQTTINIRCTATLSRHHVNTNIPISCIQTIKKNQQMHFGCMNVILLYSDHRHVSVTHDAIFRVVSERLQIYLLINIFIFCTYHREDGHISDRNMSVVITQ
jgi:hypothetical protein